MSPRDVQPPMDPLELFKQEGQARIAAQAADRTLRDLTRAWFDRSCAHKYSYNFTWLGVPIIQYPQDIVALQEVLWRTRPQLVIETGVAHGGSLVFSASMLQLMGGDGRVVGVDIDIRAHNRRALEAHPLKDRIDLVEGSSIAPATVERVEQLAKGRSPVVVILDSNHTHAHVAEELRLYSKFVGKGSYLIALDTAIEDMPADAFPDRPWKPGNSPKTAVKEFLLTTDRFEVAEEIDAKLLITVAPGGYLRCVKD
jgi:cephalosporin hydroxylase